MSKHKITDLDMNREKLLRSFSEMPGGFLIYRADSDNDEILYVNRAVLEAFECSSEDEFLELTGCSYMGMVHPDDRDKVARIRKLHMDEISSSYYSIIHRIITKKGNVSTLDAHGKFVENSEAGPLFYVFFFGARADVDGFTGLPRRLYFFELAPKTAESVRKTGQNAVVLAFDLINMKGFNSRYGMEEGDRVLLKLASLLGGCFGETNCSRFGEDHFYVCTGDADLEMKLKKLIADLNSFNRGRTLSVRIGIALYEPDVTIGEVCDRAKFASDTIDSVESSYVWYSEKIYRDISNREYVLNNVERALSEGWIEPFYQPVIRTLTERLCSVEVLARWQDPERGLISPGVFIPVMEEKGLIYKLDMYIVERVVSVLQQRLKEGLPVVPVSVNVSCSDFDYCDPVEVIAGICDAHGVRRSLICAEITETALMTDRSLVSDAVERFHRAGIDVWMDDFGSGYSSLSILRDIDFDEIKIDMGFLLNLNERARTIVTAAVRMAKQLGIHTLAEGVENEEHLNFLKSIGCERIQGYYYGRPMPLSELFDHLKERGIVFETREIAALYQKTGLVDLISELPLALIFYDRRHFEFVYANEAFEKEMEYTGMTVEQAASAVMKSGNINVGPKLRSLAENAVVSGKPEQMTFIYRNRHYRLSFHLIGSIRNGSMLSTSLEYIAFEEKKTVDVRDNVMQNLLLSYSNVYVIDFKEDSCRVVATQRIGEYEGQVVEGIANVLGRKAVKGRMHDDDLDRFERFISEENIRSKMEGLGKNNFSEIFLIKQENGNFKWVEIMVMSLPDDRNSFLICTKPALIEDDYAYGGEGLKRFLKSGALQLDLEGSEYNDLWNSFMNEADVKIFWKDSERRFMGASRAFRNYYGFKSDDDFIGKTDEEMGWHINDSRFASDDIRVLQRGDSVVNAPNLNIVNGIAHKITAWKFPVYRGNRIVGLLGYFVDVDEDIETNSDLKEGRFRDSVTGLMNAHGLISSLLDMDDNLKSNQQDYILAMITVEGYQNVLSDYGDSVAEDLVHMVAGQLKSVFRFGTIIARLSDCSFAICDRETGYDGIFNLIRNFADMTERITEIDGLSCHLTVKYGIASGSEADNIYKVWEIADYRVSAGNEEYQQLDEVDSLVSPDPYLDLPLPTVVVRPRLDEHGELSDMVFVFVNKVYCELTGKSRSELIGKGYLELFPRTDKNWIHLTYRASLGEQVHRKLYDGATHHWLRFTAMPSQIPGACILICEIIDEEKRGEKLINENRQTSDAVIGAARILDVDADLQKIMSDLLQYVGRITGCDRCFVLSIDGSRGTSIPYEWRKNGSEAPGEERYSPEFGHLAYWREILREDTSVVFESVELLRDEKPEYYEFFKSHGILWFVNSPIYCKGRMVGYLGIENFRRDVAFDMQIFAESIAYFIAARIQLHEKKTYDDIFMDLPMPTMLVRAIMDESQENSIADFEYVNVNDAYCRLFGQQRSELVGHRYQDIFYNPDSQWMSDIYSSAVSRKTVQDYRYNFILGHWVYFIAAPAKEPGYSIVTLFDYDLPHNLIIELDERKSMTRCVVQVAKVVSRETVFDVAVRKMFDEISTFVKADSFYLITAGDGREVESIYEWTSRDVRIRTDINSRQKELFTELMERLSGSGGEYLLERSDSIKNDNPELAGIIGRMNIHNMLTVPVFEGNVFLGMIGAQDIDEKKTDVDAELLRDASFFVASRLSISQKFKDLLGDKFDELQK